MLRAPVELWWLEVPTDRAGEVFAPALCLLAPLALPPLLWPPPLRRLASWFELEPTRPRLKLLLGWLASWPAPPPEPLLFRRLKTLIQLVIDDSGRLLAGLRPALAGGAAAVAPALSGWPSVVLAGLVCELAPVVALPSGRFRRRTGAEDRDEAPARPRCFRSTRRWLEPDAECLAVAEDKLECLQLLQWPCLNVLSVRLGASLAVSSPAVPLD